MSETFPSSVEAGAQPPHEVLKVQAEVDVSEALEQCEDVEAEVAVLEELLASYNTVVAETGRPDNQYRYHAKHAAEEYANRVTSAVDQYTFSVTASNPEAANDNRFATQEAA